MAVRIFSGLVRRDFLDVHAAGGRGHHGDAALFAVEREAEVDLARDLRAGLHIDLAHRQSFGARLLGDQPRAQHPGRRRAHRVGVARQRYAAGLAATARVHLGLDHPDRAAQPAAAATASSAVAATAPCGTGMP